MLAQLQRLIVVALITSAAISVAYFSSRGMTTLGCVVAMLLLFGYAAILGLEFILLGWVHRESKDACASAGDMLRAWWSEVLSAPAVFFWRQPFRSNAEPDSLPSVAAGTRGVVLVHGFVCNRGFWTPWMRDLRRRGVPFIAVNLEPVFGSIDNYPAIIEDAVARLETLTENPVILVGHSMGGLAIRAWLTRFNADARVHRVITIGSPHQGTWWARCAFSANGKQMRLNSSWLVQLASAETPARASRFTCFYGPCDNIVFPVSSGAMAGARNIQVPGVAHVHMAFRPVVFAEVLRHASGLAPSIDPVG